MSDATWQKCIAHLQDELPTQQFNTWIRPLRVELVDNLIRLCAPNRFVRDWVSDRFYSRIVELVTELSPPGVKVRVELGISERQPAGVVAAAKTAIFLKIDSTGT